MDVMSEDGALHALSVGSLQQLCTEEEPNVIIKFVMGRMLIANSWDGRKTSQWHVS